MDLKNFKRFRSDSSDSDLANIAQTELLYKVLVIGDYGVGECRSNVDQIKRDQVPTSFFFLINVIDQF